MALASSSHTPAPPGWEPGQLFASIVFVPACRPRVWEAGRASLFTLRSLPQPSSMGVTNQMTALPLWLCALDGKTAAPGNFGVCMRAFL